MPEFNEEDFKKWLTDGSGKLNSSEQMSVDMIKNSFIGNDGILYVGYGSSTKYSSKKNIDERFKGKSIIKIIEDGGISDFNKYLDKRSDDKDNNLSDTGKRYDNALVKGVRLYAGMLDGIPRSVIEAQQKIVKICMEKIRQRSHLTRETGFFLVRLALERVMR